jgi:hypothetical protein
MAALMNKAAIIVCRLSVGNMGIIILDSGLQRPNDGVDAKPIIGGLRLCTIKKSSIVVRPPSI